ncbi:MAG: calcium-binding EGF-like domain-containing protein, partial [Myxococcota bacterium]
MMVKARCFGALILFGFSIGCMGEVGDPKQMTNAPPADGGGVPVPAEDSGVGPTEDAGVGPVVDAGTGPAEDAGSGPTECGEGFVLVSGSCQDIDECMTMSPCSDNATCTNQPGSFTCACNDGYTGDGVTCTAETADCSNFSAVLADNRCVTCHDQTPGVEGGNLDLLSPGL